jgi:hypothetical protein
MDDRTSQGTSQCGNCRHCSWQDGNQGDTEISGNLSRVAWVRRARRSTVPCSPSMYVPLTHPICQSLFDEFFQQIHVREFLWMSCAPRPGIFHTSMSTKKLRYIRIILSWFQGSNVRVPVVAWSVYTYKKALRSRERYPAYLRGVVDRGCRWAQRARRSWSWTGPGAGEIESTKEEDRDRA